MSKQAHLIILRGNSGSGKTTTAKALQKKFGYGTMLISQDVIRREVLYVKDGPDTAAASLLQELADYGNAHCDIVILEGILNAEWYHEMFEHLLEVFGSHISAYYFDLPFEETLSRHQHKPNAQDFGEEDMRRWWIEQDFLDIIPEVCLPKELSLEEIVARIYLDVMEKR